MFGWFKKKEEVVPVKKVWFQLNEEVELYRLDFSVSFTDGTTIQRTFYEVIRIEGYNTNYRFKHTVDMFKASLNDCLNHNAPFVLDEYTVLKSNNDVRKIGFSKPVLYGTDEQVTWIEEE